MRIAIFTDSYYEVNGVARTYQNIAKSAMKKKVKLDIFTMGGQPIKKHGSVRIYAVPPRVPFEYYPGLIFDVAAIPRHLVGWLPSVVRTQFDKKNYDIVQVATPGQMGLYALTAAKKYDVALVGSYHTHVPFYSEVRLAKLLGGKPWGPLKIIPILGREFVWWYERYFYGRAIFNFAPTNMIAGSIWERFRRPTRIMRRGVDTKRFRPDAAKKAKRPTVLYLSRLAVEKNVDMLVGFHKYLPGVRLVIVGDGPDKKRLQKVLPEAEFKGFITGSELEETYASSHVFIFPSITETYGNVVQEAMASGLPVVLDSRGASSELVKDRVDGYHYIGKGDMYNRLAKLLNEPERAKKMGLAGRKEMETRTWDNVFDSAMESYEKAIKVHENKEPDRVKVRAPVSSTRAQKHH